MDILKIQTKLAAAGYGLGPIDGDLGPKTYNGLLNWIARRDLGERGRRLGRGMAANFPTYSLETTERLAGILGQCDIESGGFRYMEEIWGPTTAQLGYEGRLDLGNTQPGDGRKFAGHGIIQTTGRANHRRLGHRIGLDLEANPERAAEPEIAVLGACIFWQDNKLSPYADARDYVAVSRGVNRGNPKSTRPANHETERLNSTNRILGLLS